MKPNDEQVPTKEVRIKWTLNKMLNGKKWREGDLYDSWNQLQKDHFDGLIDLYAPLQDLPPIAKQWKDSYNRRRNK